MRNELRITNAAVQLGTVFTRIRSGESFSLMDENIRHVLPFLFLNPSKFRLVNSNIRSHQVAFRLNSMRSLFESPLIEFHHPLKSFESCQGASEQISFLRHDLELIQENEAPNALRLLQYGQFMGDALVVLYARFSTYFPLSVFIRAAFEIGDDAIISLCFTFPQFICPIFKNISEKADLLAILAVMSPAHMPLLLPEIAPRNPTLYALLAIKCCPNEAPRMINANVRQGVPDIIDELRQLKQQTPDYYLCLARCCARDNSLPDAELFKSCTDDELIAHMLFTVENISSMTSTSFVDRFRKREVMATILDLTCDLRNRQMNSLSEKIAKVLGDGYYWQPKTTFGNHILKNFDMKIDPSWFTKCPKMLYILDSFRDDIPFTIMASVLPQAIDIIKTVDFAALECIEHFVQSVMKTYCDKMIEFMAVMEQVLSKSGPAFELEAIEKNCCPALVYMYLIIITEERLASARTDRSVPRFTRANTIPARFVMNAAFQHPGCASVFTHICGRCERILPYLFCQAQLMGTKPKRLLQHGNPTVFLSELEENRNNVDEEHFDDWVVHRFVMPFQYTFSTIAALGGPAEITQVYETFNFPLEILRSKYTLKMVCMCMIDIVAFYQEMFRDSQSYSNPSLYIVLSKALDLLKDPNIYAEEVCSFINDLFFVVAKGSWLLETFLRCGCDISILETLTRGVKVLWSHEVWLAVDNVYNNSESSRPFLLSFASHLASACPEFSARTFSEHIIVQELKISSVTEQNAEQIIDAILRMYKVFPDLWEPASHLLESIKFRVRQFVSKEHLTDVAEMALEQMTLHAFSNTIC